MNKYCPNGHETNPGARFCGTCGVAVASPRPDATTPVESEETRLPIADAADKTKPDDSSRGGHRRMVATVVTAVLVIGGGVAVGVTVLGWGQAAPVVAAEAEDDGSDVVVDDETPEVEEVAPPAAEEPAVEVVDERSDLERALDHFIATGDNGGVLTYSEGNNYMAWLAGESWGDGPPQPFGTTADQAFVPFLDQMDWEWLPSASCNAVPETHWDEALGEIVPTGNYIDGQYSCSVARAYGFGMIDWGEYSSTAEWGDVEWDMHTNPDGTWTRVEWFS